LESVLLLFAFELGSRQLSIACLSSLSTLASEQGLALSHEKFNAHLDRLMRVLHDIGTTTPPPMQKLVLATVLLVEHKAIQSVMLPLLCDVLDAFSRALQYFDSQLSTTATTLTELSLDATKLLKEVVAICSYLKAQLAAALARDTRDVALVEVVRRLLQSSVVIMTRSHLPRDVLLSSCLMFSSLLAAWADSHSINNGTTAREVALALENMFYVNGSDKSNTTTTTTTTIDIRRELALSFSVEQLDPYCRMFLNRTMPDMLSDEVLLVADIARKPSTDDVASSRSLLLDCILSVAMTDAEQTAHRMSRLTSLQAIVSVLVRVDQLLSSAHAQQAPATVILKRFVLGDTSARLFAIVYATWEDLFDPIVEYSLLILTRVLGLLDTATRVFPDDKRLMTLRSQTFVSLVDTAVQLEWFRKVKYTVLTLLLTRIGAQELLQLQPDFILKSFLAMR
jgi:hypothetical protein